MSILQKKLSLLWIFFFTFKILKAKMILLIFVIFITSVSFALKNIRWASRAYASLNGLSNWYADLLLRIKELESWTADFSLPTSVWLSGFFNPQSFLTAIMQSTARKNELPLDKMSLVCEVTKKVKKLL